MFRILFPSKYAIRCYSVQFGNANLVGNLLKIPKSQIQPFQNALPEDYSKFLAQCKEGHFLYTQKTHELLHSLSLDTDRHKRILITGPRGTGKSMTLLSGLLYSQQKEMILIHFPTLFSFTHANHTVEPYTNEKGTFYEQDNSVIEWLKYLQKVNPVINSITTTDSCCYGEDLLEKFEANKGETLDSVIDRATKSISYPTKLLAYILEQILKVENRPPIMIAMDGLNALFSRTDVRLEQFGPPLMPRDLSVMRTIYDLVFSQKFKSLLRNTDCIIASVTNRGVLGVKATRGDDAKLTERENSRDFSRVFRPQALRESPMLKVKVEDTPFHLNGTSYKLVGIEGELLEMDRLIEFEFADGEHTHSIGIERLLRQSKEWEVNIEVKDKILYLHYKHLDDVAKDKIYKSNYKWNTDILLGNEGMAKVFNKSEPFKALELGNWNKEETETAMKNAVNDLWGRKDIEGHFIEEVYPLSSYGNPRLVNNLCRMVFEH